MTCNPTRYNSSRAAGSVSNFLRCVAILCHRMPRAYCGVAVRSSLHSDNCGAHTSLSPRTLVWRRPQRIGSARPHAAVRASHGVRHAFGAKFGHYAAGAKIVCCFASLRTNVSGDGWHRWLVDVGCRRESPACALCRASKGTSLSTFTNKSLQCDVHTDSSGFRVQVTSQPPRQEANSKR